MKRYRGLICFAVVIIFHASACAGETGQQSAYYVSNDGSDDYPGTKELPWRTLDKISQYLFSPGDTIHFARGSRFTGGFVVDSSGQPGKPITFTSYGHGALPAFTNPRYSHLNGNAIRVNGSHVVIDDLYFHNCPKSPVCEDIRTLGAIYISVGADHNTVQNCEMTKTPIGIQTYGQHTLITKNHIHDNHVAIQPHWGPVCVFVCTSNNEISYNLFENYSAASNEYGHDGGAIEINDRRFPKKNITIHHNSSFRNQGFIEFVGRVKQDNIVVHHNLSEDYQSFVGFTGPCTNMKIENNTVIRVLAHERPDSEDVTFWFYYENANLVFRNNIFVYDPSRIEPVFSRGKFARENNLYYRLDNPRPSDSANYSAYMRLVVGGGASLGKKGRIGDPLFVDFKNRNYQLRAESPAVDAGADLGYKLDIENNLIPAGAAPDIGAYERVDK